MKTSKMKVSDELERIIMNEDANSMADKENILYVIQCINELKDNGVIPERKYVIQARDTSGVPKATDFVVSDNRR